MPASRKASGAPASRTSTSCRRVPWSPTAAKNTGSACACAAPACPVTRQIRRATFRQARAGVPGRPARPAPG
eukprot:11414526-Alexandrium_andersonii.AAC.1